MLTTVLGQQARSRLASLMRCQPISYVVRQRPRAPALTPPARHEENRWQNLNKQVTNHPSAATIYIGDIPFNVKGKEIFDLFSRYGEIKFFKRMRISKYAFLVFKDKKSADEAKNAVVRMTTTLIVHNHVPPREDLGAGTGRVPRRESAENPSSKEQKPTLLVRNIPPSATEPEFHALFRQYGEIESWQPDKHMSHGWLRFRDQKAAEEAKNAVLQMTAMLSVKDADSQRPTFVKKVQETPLSRCIIVSGIPVRTTAKEIRACFQIYGQIVSWRKPSQTSRILKFKSETAAEAAKQAVMRITATLSVEEHRNSTGEGRTDSTSRKSTMNPLTIGDIPWLHVTNIPPTAMETDILALFTQYGNIKSWRQDNNSTHGFLQFTDQIATGKAMNAVVQMTTTLGVEDAPDNVLSRRWHHS
ncbi:hypothetical protein C8R43DRAFT_959197 [Mycena crocata]|nr:hypothetical protein C8R43DRAFT_959197 [Mycena crocata]